MKKLFVFALVIAVVTLAGFWGGAKVCRMASGVGSSCFQGCDPSGAILSQDPAWRAYDSAFQNKTQTLCMQICRERAVLLDQIKNSSGPSLEISSKIDQIGQLQIALEKEVAQHIFEMKKRLPPDKAENFFRRLESRLRPFLDKNKK